MVPSHAARTPDRIAFDRRLFLALAIAFPAFVVAGFARTYYLKPVFGAPPLSTWLVHAHAAAMTAWVGLFAAQVLLIRSRHVRLHQRLGYASLALVALIVATGVPVAVHAAKYGAPSTPAFIPRLQFFAVPIFDLLAFVGLYAAAVLLRRQPLAHKSLMLLACLSILPPALGRLPGAPVESLGPIYLFGIPATIALACLAAQARRYGRVERAFAWGVVALVASYVIRLSIMGTSTWLAFATWAIGWA